MFELLPSAVTVDYFRTKHINEKDFCIKPQKQKVKEFSILFKSNYDESILAYHCFFI